MSASKSTQLAEFVKAEKTTVGKNDTPAVNVHYKRLDGEKAGTEMTVRYLVGKLDQDSLAVLKELKPGGKFVVEKEKQGDFWNLTGFKPESEFKAKPAYTGGGNHNKGGYNKSSGGNSTYDTTGVKVGAARNQAIAYLAATKGTKFTLDDVDAVAYDIVNRQQTQEENVRNKTIPGTRDACCDFNEVEQRSQDQDDDIPW